MVPAINQPGFCFCTLIWLFYSRKSKVQIIDQLFIEGKLTQIMRCKETCVIEFRRLLREITLLMNYEVTRDLKLATTFIKTQMKQ